jgi:hypothetical protein
MAEARVLQCTGPGSDLVNMILWILFILTVDPVYTVCGADLGKQAQGVMCLEYAGAGWALQGPFFLVPLHLQAVARPRALGNICQGLVLGSGVRVRIEP